MFLSHHNSLRAYSSKFTVAFSVLLFVCAHFAFADTILLKNGKKYEGDIVDRTGGYVRIRTTIGLLRIPLNMVDEKSQQVISQMQTSTKGKEAQKGESAQVIREKIIAAYHALQTYKTEGTVAMAMDISGQKMLTHVDFSILLKKPNMYLISWTVKNPAFPDKIISGAAWNNGEQPYLYSNDRRSYSKMADDAMALNIAAGLSFEAARVVPALFLNASGDQSPLKPWTNLLREADESVNGVDCYVVSGRSPISKEETIWVSKSDYFIKKYSRSLTPPPQGVKTFQPSEEQLEALIKSKGWEVTNERKKAMRAQMQQAMAAMKNMRPSGTCEQSFLNSSTPTLDKKEFQFAVPKGVALISPELFLKCSGCAPGEGKRN